MLSWSKPPRAKRNEPFGESNVKGGLIAGDTGTALKAIPVAYSSGCFVGAGISAQTCGEEDKERIARHKSRSAHKVTLGMEDATTCAS